ncbi:permease for cytosine/purines, uracil, thiamine, allantoin-domain-containing protein [Epithele typhae]|uniref:permease for cytosine/purines, uracil, thiamine, allantoin-domain-containing protein n=1 Tax=Epithele typhae TaxID=378194 RepID=UPI002007B11D|nr:permease for cytosine/purines, uracil, thiamine, allantoin-domain-containing protein [Epithele typhae]KAH9910437.1 permease for cytosine/purines, uracil, thiamine, allantoin-domain-containing protein [Epithele typhae]
MPSLKPVREWAHRLSRALRSRDAFCAYVRTHGNARRAHSWTNEDLAPSPPSMVNWRAHNFCLFWFGMGFGNWTLGSSIVGAGLSWWQATIVVWIAASVSGLAMAFNSRAAANYHVGYPLLLRTSFGMYGHYWPVIARGAAAMLWVSVLNFQGGAYVSTMLRCLFGHRWETIGPRFPPSVGTTLQRFIGFLLFWLIELPSVLSAPTAFVGSTLSKHHSPSICVGLLVYCLVDRSGTRPTGPALAWLVVAPSPPRWENGCVPTWWRCCGSNHSLANMPDFARYATDPSERCGRTFSSSPSPPRWSVS